MLNEFKRASKRERSEAGGSKTPEILDVDTLMSLDEFQETNKSKFRNIKEIKEFEKDMRDAKNASLCSRCRNLRFQNKVIIEKQV